MTFLYVALLVMCIIAFAILIIITNSVTDVLVSRSLSIANGVSLLIDGQIKPTKFRFRLIGYRVFGKYKGYDVVVNLHYEFVAISIHVADKLPKQSPFFMYNPKYIGDFVRVGKDFSIYFKQCDILENETFVSNKFVGYLEKLFIFIDESKNS